MPELFEPEIIQGAIHETLPALSEEATGIVSPPRQGVDSRFTTALDGNPGDRLHAFRETYLAENVRLQEIIDETGDITIIGIEHEEE